MNTRLLASNLWPMLTTEPPNARLARSQANMVPAVDALLEALLFYDELVIPTQDYLILPVLHQALGERALLDLLDGDVVRFSRIKGSLAVGAPGLLPFHISRSNGQPYPFGADLDWTIQWATVDFAKAKDTTALMRLVRTASSELEVSDIAKAIGSEVALDFSSDSKLRSALGLSEFDLGSLRRDQVHLYGGPELPSESPGLDGYLQVAQLNAELELANRNNCNDVATSAHLDVLLRAKMLRDHRTDIGEKVLEISGVPDIGPLARSERVSVRTLLKLRNSRDGVAFRSWLHEHLTSSNPTEIAKSYTELLRGTDAVDGTAGRIIRGIMWTAATTPAGLIAGGPIGAVLGAGAGLAGSLLDSFVISKLRMRASPVVFLDRLRKTATGAS